MGPFAGCESHLFAFQFVVTRLRLDDLGWEIAYLDALPSHRFTVVTPVQIRQADRQARYIESRDLFYKPETLCIPPKKVYALSTYTG